MHICFFEIAPWQKKYLKKKLLSHTLKFFQEPLTQKHIPVLKNCEVLGVFVHSNVTQQIIQSLPKLKQVITLSTGFDHIDLATCKKRNIPVCNVPVYGEHTVAEHVFALLLALTRKLIPAITRVKVEKKFVADESLKGIDLYNKTLGLIGCGSIGKNVARIGKGFAMNVIVSDLVQRQDVAQEVGFTYVTLQELLKRSDIISIHVPYLQSTHHMITSKMFGIMKKGVILINTARGPIIDTKALVQALQRGKITGAALDVLEEETMLWNKKNPTSKLNHQLLKMQNVLVTPHNAFNTQEALVRILDTSVENILQVIKGKVQNNVIKE